MHGHGHDFRHEFVSESVFEADSDTDTRFFWTLDADSDLDKVMTSDTGSHKGMSENLGHGFALRQLSDTRVRPTLARTLPRVHL